MRQVSSEIFGAVWDVVTRRTFDRATAATELCLDLFRAAGRIERRDDELWVGDRVLNRDRDLLSRVSSATGLGICAYLGSTRVAAATVLDAGTAPDLGVEGPPQLVDQVLRRRGPFSGEVEYQGRDYVSVARPIFATGGEQFAPIGIVEAFQDKQAYYDLMSAAARAGVEDQVADVETRADGMESLIHFVDDVARRLQLLALNGNIIAAQAGEHGRPFRVVCRELGSLASQAKTAGGDARRLLKLLGLERATGPAGELGERSSVFEAGSATLPPGSTGAQELGATPKS